MTGETIIEQEVISEGGDTIIKSDLSQILVMKYDKLVTITGTAKYGEVTTTKDKTTTTKKYNDSWYNKNIEYKMNIESISYRNMVSQYNMPFSFLFTLLEISSSPKWINEVANLIVDDSRVDFSIHDNYSENNSRTITTYREIINTENSDGQIDFIITKETKNCTHSLSNDVEKVRTWLYNKNIYFKKEVEGPNIEITNSEEPDETNKNGSKIDIKNEDYNNTLNYEYKQVAEQNASDENTEEKEEQQKQLIYVGDYRTVELKYTVGQNGISYMAGVNYGYEEFKNVIEKSLEEQLDEDPNKNVVFAFGFQDTENCDKYIKEYKKFIDKYPDTKFYFLTVNPVIDEQSPNRKNSEIQEFNTKLKEAFSDKVIDTYNLITNDMIIYNGILYNSNGYNTIHNAVISKVGEVGTSSSTADGKEWIDVRPFLRLWKNATGEVEYSSEKGEDGNPINYNYLKKKSVDGKFVLYKQKNIGKTCPDEAIISGAPLMFKLLGDNEKTQNYETIMRYLLNQYTGSNKYGDIDVNEILDFFKQTFSSASGMYGVFWNNGCTKEEFVAAVQNFTPPNGTGNGGRSIKDCYNKYFVANAENFFDICTKNGIDPRFIFSIGIHESYYGTSNIANTKGNFWGWGAIDSNPMGGAHSFADLSAGIESVSSGLAAWASPGSWQYDAIVAKGYDPSTIDGIGSIYASDKQWAESVKKHMYNIFGYEETTYSDGEASSMQQKIVQIASSKDTLGTSGGYCQTWVRLVYEKAGIKATQSPACATEACNLWKVSDSKTNIPIGAAVYGYSNPRVSCGNHEAGHVGIYIGNGQVASNVGGITIESLDSWIKSFGWKGWGWQGGKSLSQGTSSSSINTKGKTSSQILKMLFPSGVPTSESQMNQYLVKISVPINDKNGKKTTTTLTVHKAVANDVKKIYEQIQASGFKIHQTYAYTWRLMNGSGTNSRSHHSYGIAIDINWDENPYVYGANPHANSPYAIKSNGPVVSAFKAYGWKWGGDWTKHDYMHFSLTGN